MDDRPFGARFIEELRRLTRSTAGFNYRDVERISRMDREEFRAAMGRLALGTSWDPAAEPEALAQAVLARQSVDDITVIVGILGGMV